MPNRRHERFKRPQASGLRIMQVNVQRGWPKHKAALQTAYNRQADVVLIQEPATIIGRRNTQPHGAFQTLIPQDAWPERPRVVTYVRKGTGLIATQPSSGLSRDLLQVRIQGPGFPTLDIWNVYNAPVGSTDSGVALELLLQQDIPSSALVAGDFNLRHPAWDPSDHWIQPGAEQLHDWADTRGLRLLNPPGVPTHRDGGVLDLAFSGDPAARMAVAEDMHTTSDHQTLWIWLAAGIVPPPRPGRLRLNPEAWNQDRFLNLLQGTGRVIYDDIEEETNDIIQALSLALQGSAPRTMPTGRGARWWTPECQEAVLAFRRARRSGPADEEKRTFRRAVRQATRAYWRSRIEQADTLPAVYRLTNWHKAEPNYPSPPLRGPNGPVADTGEKIQLLRETLLNRHLQVEDVPLDTPAVPARALPWGRVHPDEAFKAICQVSSTTPGLDEIPVAALRLAWPILGTRITALFQRCLDKGVHPAAFKAARIAILKKSGKRDRSLPKSYRPISLLSCLGKGLERLVARRIGYLALQHGLLAPNQCGAIPRHCAVDLTTALYSDIMDAWSQGKVAGIVTFDVQGAFDGVLAGRLCLRLREQGFPESLVKWTWSLLSNRSAQASLDGVTSEPFHIACGLPQGSPVSPILFLLYIEPVISLTGQRFGYADDGCLFNTGRTLAGCRDSLQEGLNQTLAWGEENGVVFEVSKTELQYFTPGRRREPEPPVHARGTEISPNDSTRWLGVIFDRSLRFLIHARQAAIRARAVTDHVKRLVGVTYGTDAALLRQAVQGTAFATLLYGCETWYNERTRENVLRLVQRTISHAARAVLPAYRTTPIPALLRETGWAPAVAWLERAHDRYAARLATTDPTHPVRMRWNRPAIRWIRRRQKLQLASAQHHPPWEPFDRTAAKLAVGATGRPGPLSDIAAWVASRPLLDLVVYSDGSAQDGAAGAGYCLIRGSESEVTTVSLGLGQTATVYDAEITAATAGLRAALDCPLSAFATEVTVCLDNEEAAIRLWTGRTTATSAGEIQEFQALRREWTRRPLRGPGKPGTVRVRWVPGHCGIRGNELADTAAKEACRLPPGRDTASRAAAKELAEKRFDTALRSYWDRCAPARYRTLQIQAKAGLPKELRLPRKVLGRLLAARSGHGDFADYHRRFEHEDALLFCTCGAEKAPDHFFSCVRGRTRSRLRAPGIRDPQTALRWILGTTKGAERFDRWCCETNFYTDICPNR